jgi:hypothetical protein
LREGLKAQLLPLQSGNWPSTIWPSRSANRRLASVILSLCVLSR